ncbi:MAG: hypothetical protein JO353_09825 [Phycisphaerae bacterium]|nr:hypothetical protein [Phycisphaerae bacterium]
MKWSGAVGLIAMTAILSVLPSTAAPAKSPTSLAIALSRPDLPEARRDLASNYSLPQAHLEVARCLRDGHQPLRAFLICEDARQRFGDDEFIRAFDQVILGDRLGFGQAREKILEKAIKLDPVNVALLHQLGHICLLNRNLSAAIRYLSLAKDKSPDDYSIVEELAEAQRQTGHDSDAAKLLDDWCARHPTSVAAVRRAVAAHQNDDDDGAIHAIVDALKQFPDDGPLLVMRAGWLHERGKEDEAEHVYMRAAEQTKSAETLIAAAHFFLAVRLDDSRALPLYLDAYFHDPHARDWASAAEHIRNIASRRPLPDSLDAALIGDHPFEAMSLIQRAIDVPQVETVPALLWKAALDDVPEINALAVAKLISLDDAQLAIPLQLALKSTDPWQRSAAVQVTILKGAPIAQAQPFFNDPATVVRYRCATALLSLKTDEARQAVARQAQQPDPDPLLAAELNDLLK